MPSVQSAVVFPLLDWFIPEPLRQDPTGHRRARMYLIAHLFGTPLSLALVGYLYVIDPHPGAPFWIILGLTAAFYVYPFLLRATGQLVLLAPISVQHLAFLILFEHLAVVYWGSELRSLGGAAFQHHLLNLTLASPALALPVLGYMAWFATAFGSFNLTNSNGLFLWSRTMSFANCAVIFPWPRTSQITKTAMTQSNAATPQAHRFAPRRSCVRSSRSLRTPASNASRVASGWKRCVSTFRIFR